MGGFFAFTTRVRNQLLRRDELMSTANGSTGLSFGYARVSTVEQNEDLQRDALEKVGCSRIFVDKASGKLGHRPALDDLLGQLRAGDTVVVWRLDRLGRSLRHLIDVVGELDRRGIALRSLTESIDVAAGVMVAGAVILRGDVDDDEDTDADRANMRAVLLDVST